MCLHGCALKQLFAQCKILFEETLKILEQKFSCHYLALTISLICSHPFADLSLSQYPCSRRREL